jgi:hypothetical protein
MSLAIGCESDFESFDGIVGISLKTRPLAQGVHPRVGAARAGQLDRMPMDSLKGISNSSCTERAFFCRCQPPKSVRRRLPPAERLRAHEILSSSMITMATALSPSWVSEQWRIPPPSSESVVSPCPPK